MACSESTEKTILSTALVCVFNVSDNIGKDGVSRYMLASHELGVIPIYLYAEV